VVLELELFDIYTINAYKNEYSLFLPKLKRKKNDTFVADFV